MPRTFLRLVLTLFALSAVPAAAASASKVDSWLRGEAARTPNSPVEFLIVLGEQADLSGATALSSKGAKGEFVYRALSEVAARSQAPLLAELRGAGIPHRPYWIVNMIWAKGDLATIESLAARSDIARIAGNPRVASDPPWVDRPALSGAQLAPAAVGSNIAHLNADDVWALGFTGVGSVIGGQDTGYDWDHPALQSHYRGWNGASADHNFDWHDAIHADISGNGTNAACGFNAVAPCDDNNHGTHTMGTMAGDDGGTNQIGMAPGAKWIGCRNMEQGWGTAATYTECYQWFLAPTDLAGQNADPALAPDVINNSWGCPLEEPSGSECEGQPADVMRAVVETLRAAGILSVHSAGNSGSGCGTVDSPSAIYDASFTVGNTTLADALNSGSSRGPVTVDGSNRRKPDVSAPGTSIRSSIPGTGYSSFTGTSMSGPHVAGLVALLIDADEALRGNIDAIEELIRESAFTGVTASGTCGGTTSADIPNNLFGWGRIDALAAVNLRQSGFLFRDDFETEDTEDWSAAVVGP